MKDSKRKSINMKDNLINPGQYLPINQLHSNSSSSKFKIVPIIKRPPNINN